MTSRVVKFPCHCPRWSSFAVGRYTSLPKGFTKARRYGGWSNTRQATYQQQCDRLQPVPPSTTIDLPDSAQQSLEAPDEVKKCPQCETEMVLESHTRRPSWRELFYGPDHPRWMEWRGSG